jgi:hypothetical protein
LQSVFNEIPALTGATLIHQTYRGCGNCQDGTAIALYATDLSPDAVTGFYRDYLQKSQWIVTGDGTGDNNGRTIQWHLMGEWPFPAGDKQQQQLQIVASNSKDVDESWYSPASAIRKAMETRRTVYFLTVNYVRDKVTQNIACPPDVANNCINPWEFAP